MKPKEIKPKNVFRIIDKESGELCGAYSRACCTEFDFESVGEARNSNIHGTYKDKSKYRIAKYRVTYELIKEDCDGAEKVKPRADGLPYDWDNWGKKRQAGYKIGLIMAEQLSKEVEKYSLKA